MTEAELEEIEKRAKAVFLHIVEGDVAAHILANKDIPALIAEIRQARQFVENILKARVSKLELELKAKSEGSSYDDDAPHAFSSHGWD